jgi:hypothetical protein
MQKQILYIFLIQILPFCMNAQTHYVSKKISLEQFEIIKNFILEKGDTKTYRNYDNNNPHYSFKDYDVYLGSDVGQKNINNDPKKSDFNELVIQYKGEIPLNLKLIAMRKGDIGSNKEWISKSMIEGNVYVQKIKNISVAETEDYIESFFYRYISTKHRLEIICGDLWEIYDEKPAMVEFLECSKGDGQLLVEAMYRVKGRDIPFIEKLLIKKYGMGKLKFVCCLYENENGDGGIIKNQKLSDLDPNFYISITMFSDDDFLTKDRKKKQPHEFDFMYIMIKIHEV